MSNSNRIEQTNVAKSLPPEVFVPPAWLRMMLAAGIAVFGVLPAALATAGVAIPVAVAVAGPVLATALTAVSVELGMRAGTPKKGDAP